MNSLWSEIESNAAVLSRFQKKEALLIENVTQINKVYRPSTDHNEVAHRLVIHAVINAACDFCNVEWTAEEAVFSARKQGTLGYGPLDCFFPSLKTILVRELVDEETEQPFVQEDEKSSEEVIVRKRAADAEADVDEGGEEEEQGQEEAKAVLSDRSLAQAGAQMVDLCWDLRKKLNSPVTVHGILCTAHRWLFFSVSISNENTKPVLLYRGEANIRVLRSTLTPLNLAKKYTSPSRRPSYCAVDEKEIDPKPLRACLLSMLTCMLKVTPSVAEPSVMQVVPAQPTTEQLGAINLEQDL